MTDKGVSAYTGKHRENPDRHCLAAFLRLVEQGKVPRGSYLIVEALDRLTREDIQPALLRVLSLLQAGIRIVQLLPVEVIYTDRSPAMEVMMMIMELSRGHGESQMKEERIGAAWVEKKRRGQSGESQKPTERMGPASKILTASLPLWLEAKDGQAVPIKKRAAVVQRIFQLALSGYGITSIAKKFNTEGVATFGKNSYWADSYVAKILYNRAVLGEYQPHTVRGKQKRKPEGKPIPDYFPRIISDEVWHASRASLASRKTKGGRPPSHNFINLFQCLTRDAIGGGQFITSTRAVRAEGGDACSCPTWDHSE
jgi:DNA invertase Pin-like site-specific DNA recombinase